MVLSQISSRTRSALTALFHSRYSGWGVAVGIYLAVCVLTRISLILAGAGELHGDFLSIIPALLVGLLFDLFVAACLCALYFVFLTILPERWLKSVTVRGLVLVGFFIYTFGLLYLGVVEYFFFGEFDSRFNYVAVDYLLFPHEVFVNLWDTYPVFQVLIASAIIALLVVYYLRRTILVSRVLPQPRGAWPKYLLLYVAIAALGYFGLSYRFTQVSDNRVLNEIAGNGYYSFFYALSTNELDYDTYYARIDDAEADRRVRDMVRKESDVIDTTRESVPQGRMIRGAGEARRFNVVLVLEESFGSKFVGLLHPENGHLTPEFDSLAMHGLLLRHIYATGNRTVRGIEATLAGFPPLPGNSIVRRPGGHHVFTLPSVLKSQGYQTTFIYGGRSYFDNLGDFAANNDFDRVIDQTDMRNVQFKTIWGVCDEDLFNNALTVCDSMSAGGKPFFATLLTVSNHTPYTYPEGRIAADPKQQRRENAVSYADYAIGKFIRDARSHKFFDSTLFVFLGDHGARVYGAQQIPMDSYEIPVLLYCPALIPEARPVDILGSQLDVAPTILGLLNVSYESQFFGRNLLDVAEGQTWALMNHNRDVALLRDNRLAVLGLKQDIELWARDPDTGKFTRLPVDSDSGLVRDAIAWYQTAYREYRTHALRPATMTAHE